MDFQLIVLKLYSSYLRDEVFVRVDFPKFFSKWSRTSQDNNDANEEGKDEEFSFWDREHREYDCCVTILL